MTNLTADWSRDNQEYLEDSGSYKTYIDVTNLTDAFNQSAQASWSIVILTNVRIFLDNSYEQTILRG